VHTDIFIKFRRIFKASLQYYFPSIYHNAFNYRLILHDFEILFRLKAPKHEKQLRKLTNICINYV